MEEEMKIEAFYQSVGGDYREVSARLQSDALIGKFLLKFPQDPSYTDLQKARAAGDIHAAFRAVHTLKGVASTLGLGRLATAASALTEELRPLTAFPENRFFDAVATEYEAVLAAIRALQADS